VAGDPRFAAALRYVDELLLAGSPAHTRLAGVAAGATNRVDLGGGTFVLEQAYQTRLRPESFFESHRKYIDVQVIVEGAELMEVVDIGRLPTAVAYDPDRDLIKYGDSTSASHLVLQPGEAVVFFPADGHMPTLQVGGRAMLVRKSVVKVPVG
jgi:YhcH/YjgK/YiaL family protein